MRKMLIALLSALMLLTMPMTISADGEVAQIGDEKYATLQLAFDAVKNGEIIELLDNTTGGGAFLGNGSKSFTIDLNNYTYTFSEPPVGSTGTENQGLHLEKGNTVTIKDGTLNVKKENASKFRFVIQNYCDLTLDNVTVDGKNLEFPGKKSYTVSNNCGNVEIKDSTLIAVGNNIAFDTYKDPSYDVPTVTIDNTTVNGKFEVSDGNLVIKGGSFSDLSGINYLDNSKDRTYSLNSDVVLSEPLDINLNNTNTAILDLGGHTVTGRINLRKGNLLIINGKIQATGDTQPLNVYGSTDTTASRYSVLTIDKTCTVEGGKFGICMFGNTAGTNGYGAAVNVHGKVSTIGSGAEGTVFVSGNLGNGIKSAGGQNNIIEIYGDAVISSVNDTALALNGNADVTIHGGTLSGNTALTVKRGALTIEDGQFTSTGGLNETVTLNNNGTEMTGAAVSVTQTYSKYGPLSVNIKGGNFVATKGYAIFKNKETDEHKYIYDATITISGGTFSDLSGVEYLEANKTYTLNSDVTLTKTVEFTKDATLDLNGHNITGDGVRAIHVKEGVLKITGAGTISAGGAIADNSSVIRVGDDSGTSAALTVDNDVNITSDVCYGITYFGKDTQTVTINGKVEVTGENPAISGNGTSTNGYANVIIGKDGLVSATQSNAIYNPQSGKLTINGTVKGGVEVKAGTAEVAVGSTAKIEARNVAAERNTNNNGCSTKGYAIAAVNNSGYKGNAKVEIKGGIIAGPIAVLDDTDTSADKKCSIVITGGDFTTDFDEKYVAQGYKKATSTVSGCLKTVEKVTDTNVDVKEDQPKTDIGTKIKHDDVTKISTSLDDAKVEELVEAVKPESLNTIINKAISETAGIEATDENLKVEIFVKVEAKEATLTGAQKEEEKTLTFTVKPYAKVSNGTTESAEIRIENKDLGSNAKIKVTLPTCGIVPVEVVHVRDNGSKEYFYATGAKAFVYDEVNETVTFEISDFSDIVINAKVTKPAPKKSSKSYKAPVTGIR